LELLKAWVANEQQLDINNFFEVLGAWAAGEQRFGDLSQVLPEPLSDWPPELQCLWERLGYADTRLLAGNTINQYSAPTPILYWINALDDRLIDILRTRVLATRPETLDQIGERYDVTRERVRQLENKVRKKLARFRKSAEYRPVRRRAGKLREKLGSAIPENDTTLTEALNWAVSDFDPGLPQDLAQSFLLWIAGPYKVREGWLVINSDIFHKSQVALLNRKTNRALIPTTEVHAALSELSILDTYHSALIDHLKIFMRVDEGLLHFAGSISHKAEQLLRYFDRPITADELVEFIGSSNVRSVLNRLMDDPRFWRINKQNQFVLAGTEGYDEYTGITDEIIQELEACGGSATVQHLVEKITKTYGVQPNSVLAYLKTPLFFQTESGLVRVRKDEEVIVKADISRTVGCYRLNGWWSWRVKVDRQLLRGSGRLFPKAFARELGCGPGDKFEISSPFGSITVSWPLGSTTGAALGSIREVLDALGATDGDYLFVIAQNEQLGFQLLRQEHLKSSRDALTRLARLVGVHEFSNPEGVLPQIAAALEIDQDDSIALDQQIKDALLSRGENDLGDLIKPSKLSMDQYLNRIGSTLGSGN